MFESTSSGDYVTRRESGDWSELPITGWLTLARSSATVADVPKGSVTMTAAAPDYDEIVRVVQLYANAFNGREGGPIDGPDPVRVDMLREAFHEDAWIFFTDRDGTLVRHLISESFAQWAGPREDSGSDITGRIISVTQAGDVASVLLGFDNARGEEFSWIDFHALLRINGVWKITNKTATHATRAAWAADRSIGAADVVPV
jgi:hypothetical protein